MIDEATLDELERLEKAATPSEWELWTSNSHRRITRQGGQQGGVLYGTVHKDGVDDLVAPPGNLELIVAARNALPTLIAAAREGARLRRMLIRLLESTEPKKVQGVDRWLGQRKVIDEIYAEARRLAETKGADNEKH